MELTDKIIDLGAVAVIFIFCIKEFFVYLKQKKDGGAGLNQAILRELQLMNGNHLHTIQECVESGNRQLVETIHDDNTKIIEILGRIDGKLSK